MKRFFAMVPVMVALASFAAFEPPPAKPAAPAPVAVEVDRYVEECSTEVPPREGELGLPPDKAMGFEFSVNVY